jgi:hypothetical protein
MRKFELPRKFDPNEYLRRSRSVFKGGDDYEVVVDFDLWATDLIRRANGTSARNLPNCQTAVHACVSA